MANENAGAEASQTELEQEETTDTKAVEGEKATEKPAAKSEKVYTLKEVEAQVSKAQSAAFKEAAQAKRDAETAAARAVELGQKYSQLETRLKAAEAAQEREFEETLRGIPEGEKLIAMHRRLQEREKALSERETAADQKYSAGEFGLKVTHAMKFAEEYGLDDHKKLLGAETESDMKSLAADLKAQKLEKEIEELRSGSKKTKPDEAPDDNPEHIDSGAKTTAPKQLDDDEFITQYSLGKRNSPKDHKRAKEILDKIQKGG